MLHGDEEEDIRVGSLRVRRRSDVEMHVLGPRSKPELAGRRGAQVNELTTSTLPEALPSRYAVLLLVARDT